MLKYFRIFEGHGYCIAQPQRAQDWVFNRWVLYKKHGSHFMGRIAKYNQVVLWVDDDPFILDFGGEALEILGYKPVTAKSGSEAIDIYAQYQKGICLVILDMLMPLMSGDEVYARLAKMNPGVKVLIVTGFGCGNQVEKILTNPETDILEKPFTLDALSRKIDNLLNIGTA